LFERRLKRGVLRVIIVDITLCIFFVKSHENCIAYPWLAIGVDLLNAAYVFFHFEHYISFNFLFF